jgi:hypothetical protein
MGAGEWQVWLLKITGSRMVGALKRTDGTLLRNMTLEKDR